MSVGSERVTRLLAVLFVLLSCATTYTFIQQQQELQQNRGAITVLATAVESERLARTAESEKRFEANRRAERLAERVDGAVSAVEELANQVESLGAEPVVVPEQIPGAEGARGDRGRRGRTGPPPTTAQIATAVRAYCSTGRCDPEGPTATQVLSALSQYCNSRGECRGAAGSPGRQGPPPTADQMLAALQTFCSSRNDCAGKPGEDGKDGRDGVDGTNGTNGVNGLDGRSIVAVSCDVETERFVVLYSTGESQVVENSDCVAEIQPDTPES